MRSKSCANKQVGLLTAILLLTTTVICVNLKNETTANFLNYLIFYPLHGYRMS